MRPEQLAGHGILIGAAVLLVALEVRRHRRARGQALVETALVLPVLLFMGLGFIEAGFLLAEKADQDRRTAVVASWAAIHPADVPGPLYAAVVDAQRLASCVVDCAPDAALGLVTVAATCQYHPVATRGLWDGLPIASTASAALPSPSPEPSPSGSIAP